MPTIQTEGVQTATISTEHTLATVSTAGNYVLAVDVANHANGDITRLRLKTKLTTGDTSQLAYHQPVAHAQAIKNIYSVPIPVVIELVATLQQSAGTGRSFIWAIYAL